MKLRVDLTKESYLVVEYNFFNNGELAKSLGYDSINVEIRDFSDVDAFMIVSLLKEDKKISLSYTTSLKEEQISFSDGNDRINIDKDEFFNDNKKLHAFLTNLEIKVLEDHSSVDREDQDDVTLYVEDKI